MFRIKEISFSYQANQAREALKNIDLDIEQGELVVISGKSGCGKTSLTRVLNGLIPKYFNGEMKGSYHSDYFDGGELKLEEYANWVGSVFQDPRSQFFARTPKSEIVFPMENQMIPREEMHERYDHVTYQLGIQALADQSIFLLSSGEKQKVAIASACCMRPKLIVLDEPSSNLDLKSIDALKHILSALKQQDFTIVLSEHRFSYAYDLLDKFILMKDGYIKENLTRRELLKKDPEFYLTNGLRMPMERMPLLHEDQEVIAPPDLAQGLYLQGISLRKAGKDILKESTLWLGRGRVIGIAGHNGAGKSSLCKIISGIEKPTTGTVTLDGSKMSHTDRLKRSFYAGQDADYQLYSAQVGFELTFNNRQVTQKLANEMLEKVGLMEFADRHPLSLSGGQKQRLLIAVAMVQENKDIIILDEPTSGLDAENMQIIANLLEELKQKNKIVLLITHDVELLNQAADELILIQKGVIVSQKKMKRKEVSIL